MAASDFNLEELIVIELADLEHNPWGITSANYSEKIEERSQLFKSLSPEIIQFCQQHLKFTDKSAILVNLWRLWLPLAMQLKAAKQELGRTLIQGILGGQGTGKSTLALITKQILSYWGYSVVNLSIDDLYLTYAERQELQKQDPRLIWRGPPGTHDVNLGIEVIEACSIRDRNLPVFIPRFDKSAFNGAGDRAEAETVARADIVLFEGWFVGVRPVAEAVFDNPPPPIITPEDRQFALDNNERLKEYLPLWDKLDRLIVLYPVDYRLSKQWRKEAEHKMIAAGRSGMSDAEIDRFVEYFWKSLHPELFVEPLIGNPNLTDLVIEIERDRSFERIFQP